MLYATPQDLIARLGDREARAISDRAGAGTPNLVELTRLIAEAQAEVDSYVGRRYTLPLTDSAGQVAVTPPLTLTRITIDIARYNATGTEIMGTEQIAGRHKAAIRFLESIADGTVKLGDYRLAGAGGPAPTGGSSAVRTGAKTFSNLPEVL